MLSQFVLHIISWLLGLRGSVAKIDGAGATGGILAEGEGFARPMGLARLVEY
jgi:hypothetical protein